MFNYCTRAGCDSLHVTQDISMHDMPSSSSILMPSAMIGENRQLVTNEPVEFEEEPVEVKDCRKIRYSISFSKYIL